MREYTAPEWLLKGQEVGLCSCYTVGRRRREGFLERTVREASDAAARSLFSEQLARMPGLLQRRDPRIKLLGMLMLLVVASWSHRVEIILGLYIFLLGTALLSKVPVNLFVKRVWVTVPVFTGLVVLPSIFNIVTPGDPLLAIAPLGSARVGPFALPEVLTITRQGLLGAVTLVARVGVSVSAMLLLTLTTRWSDLLKALRSLLVPRVFIVVLAMTYRYIFLLLSLAEEMFTARRSRQVGRKPTTREGQQFVASAAATLLGKSYALSQEVYSAMVSRGFRGRVETIHTFSLSPGDLALALTMAGAGVAALVLERYLV
jgi:cobalt/nickel transport system permease protein